MTWWRLNGRDPAVGLFSYSVGVMLPDGDRSVVRLEKGRQPSNSHVDPPHIGQRSGAAAQLAP
jgi:hypothetical protein